ncbi:MAG: Leucyl-tRNA ligase LeuS [Candidatus Nomurabacteria bacterium GW2011_GWE1_32_28]|uniref:Leucine--tRNA ligase n=1 Tax=Candidatus Nomurabacteria bacterium GW2011_GWF1_31_48 TaxID=1618767 RepID=A0A0F9YEL2_9BACT|nr:MAG: Leucyl-tRNA ligase LeuS [Candidatus Nomurabacteria bacterium GW2011_GWF2_30_133]KKP28499.1 MAG: Leucyl-tRNA ligase LeuS [Candidatus Nomurabacteria bacterium GW2011_GWE2_31_40]KKP30094.1 MAG: Leucyl-tRNA ligase LeuS [Candidatus Nomurabacteria bacterium GW2011_GWF1_31_48]KKP34639.1 MAG: Leucyl-tRNA ligase LeuS [Candidatus Nomurabacteria bacterium GW2011_GWE1_32_28]HAS80899.1 leucine--tRNA ligase [Candidatus Nomurabacteria bacterium]
MKEYNHTKIEKKWQKVWEEKKIYKAKDPSIDSRQIKKKFYSLIEFPYPSGDGLHVGHIRSNTAMDIISRKRRMEGYNVLYPIGWDAFGLPTENYAIKTGKKPSVVTKKNTNTFRGQLKEIGFSFDWTREINTTDPEYYKWTQWIFLQFFKKGLAYKAKSSINWCPSCKIGLANEEAVGGICERCGSATEKKEKEQWMLAITKYADRLDKDLDLVDFPERVKSQQRNWIGKSEGSEIEFKLKITEQQLFHGSHSNLNMITESNIAYAEKSSTPQFLIKVFTTRADTLFGVTYVVLAPEHELINKLITNYELQITNIEEIKKYIEDTKRKSELERTSEDKTKTGVEIKGVKAINPANNEEIPIWIADYVLVNYGTGAVMAVPQHDARDREFAEKFNLPIIDKPLVNKDEITKKVGGEIVTKFKLRDWVFSRQRYWGEPIPLINCEKCGLVPVVDKDLPVKLPEVRSYKPTDTGESPLSAISKWVNTKCPKCKGKAKRETDTMPNWAGSSWYYLRYIDSKNKISFSDKKKLKYWTPVDWYNGGMEHTTLHLLYSRFWHKFLYDLKLVPTVEPYQKRTSHGMILGEGGVKMSKSLGNVINPDNIVKTYGADTLRIYEMFMGPFEESVAWSTESIIGSRRFIEKVWRIGEKIITNYKLRITNEKNKIRNSNISCVGQGLTQEESSASQSLEKLLHKTIKKVSEDIENMRFNTAISSMMILTTEMEKSQSVNLEDYKKFLQILAPFAPHITEELYDKLRIKNKKYESIHFSEWPKWDENLIKDQEVKIAVQINGKVRSEIMIDVNDNEEKVKEKALLNETVLKYISGSYIKKIIYIKNRLINILI